jgi:hypothetical protein
MKTKPNGRPTKGKGQAQLSDKIVSSEKLTKKNRRQTKIVPPERRIVNRFRESHREPGINPPRGQKRA